MTIRGLLALSGLLLAANLLLAASCDVKPGPAPVGAGGAVATGGANATGGAIPDAAGGAATTGGDASTGGTTAAIAWPECSKTLKAGPIIKRKLGRMATPKSKRTVQPWHAVGIVVHSVLWQPNIAPLDQADLGACTGFATAGELSTQPFALKLTNADGRAIYSLATKLDPFAGSWPPTDTGSTGDAALSAAIKLGHASSFSHAPTLADMHAAIQTRPGIFGSNWTSDMFAPDRCGQVHPTGAIEGGHEYEYIGFDKERGREWFRNSWSSGWGLSGYFWMTSDDVQTLIDDGADADFADLTKSANDNAAQPLQPNG